MTGPNYSITPEAMLHPAIGCGTTTAGTGTITLAAVPGSVGLVDPDAWAKATGIGFVNGNAILVPYIIKEFTDTTFSKPKNTEKGWGTLTLGAALVNATLARTTVQETWSANADTFSVSAPSAITIGTAANVLVFIGPAASEIPYWSPYYETVLGDQLGVSPAWGVPPSTTFQVNSGFDQYLPFEWRIPMLVKRASVRVATAYAGLTGTPVSTVYARIYAIGTNGRPGKLLYDFGTFGTNPLNTLGNISSGASGNGYFLTPGEYFFDLIGAYSGATGSITNPAWKAANSTFPNGAASRLGTSTLISYTSTQASGGTSGAAPDPANTTSYSGQAGLNTAIFFALKPS